MKPLTDALRPSLRAGDLAAPLSTAACNRGAAARVAQRVLQHALCSPGQQSATAEAALEAELTPIRRRLPWAKHLAVVASLLGPLGWLCALVDPSSACFAPLSRAAHARMLTGMASDALVSTEAGLLLAALCLILAAVTSGVVRHFEYSLRRETRVVLGLLETHRSRLRLHVGTVTLSAQATGPAKYR
ncbi:MAG: MotA/TolQ/ExbB proton channel family protein [Sandaracinaceae bacterium]